MGLERIFASEDDGEFEREPDRGSDEGEVRSEDDGTVRADTGTDREMTGTSGSRTMKRTSRMGDGMVLSAKGVRKGPHPRE